MFAISSLAVSFLSPVDLFLMWCLLTTFLARLLRLLGEVWARRLSCEDHWKGSLLARDTPNMHCGQH